MKEPFEPTQSGNPKQFTIRQHVFPRSVIARFARNGKVLIFHRDRSKPYGQGPKALEFVTLRKWDQKIEKWLATVDGDFAGLIRRYRKVVGDLNPDENGKVSRFFASWLVRWELQQKESENVVLNVAARGTPMPADRLPKGLEEQLEDAGVAFSRDVEGRFTVPSRFLYGDQLVLKMGQREREFNAKVRWRCSHFDAAVSLLVPDVPDFAYIPFEPTKCFVGLDPTNTPAGTFLPSDLNGRVKAAHKHFYFCCPP
jgi:hypothetical protein